MTDPLDKSRRPRRQRAERLREAPPRAVDPDAPSDFGDDPNDDDAPELPAADVNALFDVPDLPLFNLPKPEPKPAPPAKRQKTRTRQRRVIDSKFADPVAPPTAQGPTTSAASGPAQLWTNYQKTPAPA